MKSFVKSGVLFTLGIVLALGSCDFEPPGRIIHLRDNIGPVLGGENPGGEDTYTVTFNSNARDGTGTMEDSVFTGEAGEKLRKNTFTRAGYAFAGWATTEGGEVEYADEEDAANLAATEGSITLYAVWKVNTYTVKYNATDGSGTMADSAFTVGVEETLRKNTFTNTGYTFAGWAAAADEEDVIYADEETVKDLAAAGGTVTLYAVWSSNIYTVVYNSNGGTGTMADSVIIVDASVKLRKNTFTRDGYAFAGWAKTTGGTVAYADQASVKNLTAAGGTVTLYAKWKVSTYTVVYDPNGGTGTMDNSVFTVGVEETLQQNAYTNTGYTFVGWSETEGGEVNYEDEETVTDLAAAGDTVTLYAVWSAKTYTVVYNSNGGTGAMVNSVFTVGETVKLRKNTFSKTGFVFAGWAKTTGGTVAYADQASVKNLAAAGGTVTLYAIWNVNTYTVKYNSNGGSGTMTNSTFTVGVLTKLPSSAFTRTDCTFVGWVIMGEEVEYAEAVNAVYMDEEYVKDLAEAGDTVMLYAVWGANTYTVAYRSNSGTGTMANSIFTIGVEGNLQANAFSKAGYVFAGWAKTTNGSVLYANEASVTDLTTIAGDTVILYAKWNVNTYTVVYDANGGSGTTDMEDSVFTVGAEETLRANEYTRTGYAFAGWATAANGSVSYANEASVTNLTTAGNTRTLYAIWDVNTYTVKYNANSGSGTTMTDSVFTVGVATKLQKNTYTRTGYTFDGWATTIGGAVEHTDEKSVTNLAAAGDTITLYAVWKANTYTVKYNANGGSGTMTNSSFTYGTAADLRTNAYTRTNYTFAGWATTTTGTVEYADGASVSNLTATAGGTVNLYAVWNVAQRIVTTINGVDVAFQHIPAGSFQRDSGTSNISKITKAYYMSETEVTQELFNAIMGVNPSYFDGGSGKEADSGETQDQRPVDQVSWYAAIAFCNKLSLAAGKTPVYTVKDVNWATLQYSDIPTTEDNKWHNAYMNPDNNGYRLPTEMEWMWAAMGADTDKLGKTNITGYTKAFAGDDGSNSVDDYAWHKGNTDKTHEVGKKSPNELGLYDMSGNVWEWCMDNTGNYPNGLLTDYERQSDDENGYRLRIARGGSHNESGTGYTKLEYRNIQNATLKASYFGIRLVCR